MMTGSLVTVDGRPALRFERRLDASLERAWRGVTEPAELERWFVAPVPWTPEMGADDLAGRLGKSRSEVYPEALADYVAQREPGAVTRALDTLVDELDEERDGFATHAARRSLEQTEW